MSVLEVLQIVLTQLNTIHVHGEADISAMDSAMKNIKELMKVLKDAQNGGESA